MTLNRKSGAISAALLTGVVIAVIIRHAIASGPTVDTEAEHAPPVPVQTAELRFGKLTQTAIAYGVVQASAQRAVALTAKFDAVITSIHVAQGEAVSAEMPLFDLSASPEAQLALSQAEDATQAADRNLEQVKKRRDDQLATNADVTTAEQSRQVAHTQLNAMKSRGVGIAKSMTAPAAGVITQLTALPGQTVAAGTVLALITPQNGLEAKIGLDPAIAYLIAAGMAFDLRDVNSDSEPMHATLRTVGHSIDLQSRRVDAFITPPSDAKLLAGAFVEAKFAVKTIDGLIAPRDATRQENDQWTLYTIHDGKAVKHIIKIGLTQDHDVQVIADDLKAGDAIITARNGELADGAAVTIEAPATQPAADAKGAE